ncbi:MAG: hypothetical protein HRU25_06170 [Psychrobium sp.]|nr:hypothetical protein [Psychrobium sp.]
MEANSIPFKKYMAKSGGLHLFVVGIGMILSFDYFSKIEIIKKKNIKIRLTCPNRVGLNKISERKKVDILTLTKLKLCFKF